MWVDPWHHRRCHCGRCPYCGGVRPAPTIPWVPVLPPAPVDPYYRTLGGVDSAVDIARSVIAR